jgi:transposase InsO family protein
LFCSNNTSSTPLRFLEEDLDSDTSSLSDVPSDLDDQESPFELLESIPPTFPDVSDNEENNLTLEQLLQEAYDADELVQDLIAAKNQGLRRLPQHIMNRGIKLSMGDLAVRENRLWINNRLFIPDNKPLRLRLMEIHHQSRFSGHPGPKNLYRNLLRNYWWPRMRDNCGQFANNCAICRRSKARTTQKQGLLQPLPVPQHRWIDISMDLIEDVPACIRRGQTFRHCLVVVDRLSKDRIYEPLERKTVDCLVEAIHRRVFCTTRLPRSIVSDRGSQFVSHFWRRYCQRYGVSIKLSSAHHPETDGQTENANKILKNYLRAYIDYLQDNWVDYLPDAQFAVNNWVNESIGMSPFFANRGYHPRMGTEPPGTYDIATHREIERADEIIQRTEKIREWLQDELTWAQEAYTRYANVHRQPHPEYRIGDLVYVDARNFSTSQPSQSLAAKARGPWPIVRVIDNKAYELELPEHLRESGLTPIFHPWKLSLAARNPYPGQITDPDDHVILVTNARDDELHQEWEILQVIDCREHGVEGIQYKALFVGDWPQWNSDPPWQHWTDLIGAPDKVLEFHDKHPEKPKPPLFFTNPELFEQGQQVEELDRRGGG